MQALSAQKISTLNSLIDNADMVSIVTHTHPDGDALGSGLAVKLYLEQVRGKKVIFCHEDNYSRSLNFLFTSAELENEAFLKSEDKQFRKALQGSDLIFCVDCNSFSRTEKFQKIFSGSKAPKVLIDHHLNPETESFDLCFSEIDISSASELVFHVLKAMPDIDGNLGKLPPRCLTAILTGITTDTNNFANSVYPSTLAAVAELIAAGVDRDAILEHVYNEYPEGRIRLIGQLLSEKLTITPEGGAYMILTRKMLRKYQLEEGDTQGIVNLPLAIKDVKLSILLREESHHFRVSLRSKEGVSANQMAKDYFHGGGHEKAAGGKLFCQRDIIAKFRAGAYLRRSIKAFLGAAAALCLLLVSCSKADNGYDSQVKSINEYVTSQLEDNPDYSAEYSGDIVRLTIQQGEGEAVTENGLVKMFYAGYVFNNGISSSSLFATNHHATADAAHWILSGTDYENGAVVDLSDKKLLEGLRKGLKGVRPSEECYIIFPAQYGMGDESVGTIPAGSPLIYRVWVIDVENK